MPTLIGQTVPAPAPIEPRDRLHVLFGIEAFVSGPRWVSETNVEGVAFELLADLATTVVTPEPKIETTLKPPAVVPSAGRGLSSIMMGDLGTIANDDVAYENVLQMFIAGLKRSIVVHGYALLAVLHEDVLREVEHVFAGNERAERELLKRSIATALGARQPFSIVREVANLDDEVRIGLEGLVARPVL